MALILAIITRDVKIKNTDTSIRPPEVSEVTQERIEPDTDRNEGSFLWFKGFPLTPQTEPANLNNGQGSMWLDDGSLSYQCDTVIDLTELRHSQFTLKMVPVLKSDLSFLYFLQPSVLIGSQSVYRK